MTPKQRNCLAFIAAFRARQHGVSPTYEQICAGLGLRSKNSVARLIYALEKQGLVRRAKGRARAIEPLGALYDEQAFLLAAHRYCAAMASPVAAAILTERRRTMFGAWRSWRAALDETASLAAQHDLVEAVEAR